MAERPNGYIDPAKLRPLSDLRSQPMTRATSERRFADPIQQPHGRRRELLVFLFLTVVLAPVLAVAFVGGWGFLVWIYQMIYGPPGPPPA